MRFFLFLIAFIFLNGCEKERRKEEFLQPPFIFEGTVRIDSILYTFEPNIISLNNNSISFNIIHYKNGVYSLGFSASNISINDTIHLDSANMIPLIILTYGKGDVQYSGYDPVLDDNGYIIVREIDKKNYQINFDSEMYCPFGPGCLLYTKPADTIKVSIDAQIEIID